MQRKGMVIGIKPDKIEKYKRLHANTWPEVLDNIAECNIKNFSIFIHEKLLFGYFEYHGNDLDADMKIMADNKKVQEWWKICVPLLEPLETGKRADGWIYMEEIFHTG